MVRDGEEMTTIDHQQAAVRAVICSRVDSAQVTPVWVNDESEIDAFYLNPPAARQVIKAATPHLRAAWEQPIRELHKPIEVEPSDTICRECSFQLSNGHFFGKVVDWPCPTIALLEGGGE